MDDLKIIKSLEDLGLMIDRISKTGGIKIKNQKFGTSGASMIGNMLTRKVVFGAGKGFARAGTRSKKTGITIYYMS